MAKWCMILMTVFFWQSCDKDRNIKEADYLNLIGRGDDRYIAWESLTFQWDSVRRELVITGSGYDLKHCRIKIRNVSAPRKILVTDIDDFYYKEGVSFVPDIVSGNIIISELSEEFIKGSFEADLTDWNRNHYVHVTGNFADYFRN